MTEDPGNLIFKYLQRVRREMNAHFNAVSHDMSAIHHKLDMVVTAKEEIAAAQASHGEISVVHSEVGRLRELVTGLDARVAMLEPEEETAS
jgi:hypothetical protein